MGEANWVKSCRILLAEEHFSEICEKLLDLFFKIVTLITM